MRSVDVTERSSKRRKPIYGYRACEDLYASVRHGDWKLLAYRGGRLDLFNIANDKEEQHELSATQPKQVAELKANLIAWEHAGIPANPPLRAASQSSLVQGRLPQLFHQQTLPPSFAS